MPGWTLSADFAAFEAAAGLLLRARPVENTIALTVLENRRSGIQRDDDLFGWWTDPAGAVRGATMHTPPYNLLLAEVPEDAFESLAGAWHERRRELPGVTGPRDLTRRFADAWRERSGAKVSGAMEARLYSLDCVSRPDPMPEGRPRLAGRRDRGLLIQWFERFGGEAFGMARDRAPLVDDQLSYGGLTLWEVAGDPVSVAGVMRLAAGCVRVGPVYTPPDRRRRGYGTAATWAVTRAALAAGAARVVLFADLANPTSNSIYQSIGFRPVGERLLLSFAP